jgi:hypothetical protein
MLGLKLFDSLLSGGAEHPIDTDADTHLHQGPLHRTHVLPLEEGVAQVQQARDVVLS